MNFFERIFLTHASSLATKSLAEQGFAHEATQQDQITQALINNFYCLHDDSLADWRDVQQTIDSPSIPRH